MLHRSLPSYLNQDYANSVNFFEVCRWFLFYLFIEISLPFFLDPLQLTDRFFDIPVLEWFELIYFIIIPNLVIFLYKETSPYGSTYGLLLYLFLTSTPWYILQKFIFQDLFVLVSIISLILEFFIVEPNEESYYDD